MLKFWKTAWFEQFAPIVAGVAALATCVILRHYISPQFEPDRWDESNLFVAVFNWAAIQSGFIFGIYGFVASKRDGFVGELTKGGSFDRFIGYARRAYVGGFFLTFVSLPLLVVSPSINGSSDQSYWFLSTWFGLFVWAFCAFLRVAFIFGKIAATPDKKPRIVG